MKATVQQIMRGEGEQAPKSVPALIHPLPCRFTVCTVTPVPVTPCTFTQCRPYCELLAHAMYSMRLLQGPPVLQHLDRTTMDLDKYILQWQSTLLQQHRDVRTKLVVTKTVVVWRIHCTSQPTLLCTLLVPCLITRMSGDEIV